MAGHGHRHGSRAGLLVAIGLAAVVGVACAAPGAPASSGSGDQAGSPAPPAPTTASAARPAGTVGPATKPTARPAANATAVAEAAADFYKDKTVKVVLGLAAGSTADAVVRTVVKYLPRYIAGQPTVIVENKPGAGGIIGANLVYNVEPKDGSVISAFVEGNVLQQALGAPGIEFDAGKLQWLGSPIRTTGACLARADGLAKSLEEAIAGTEIIIGGTAPGATTFDIAAVTRAALGANFRLVPGYDSGAKMLLALESHEIDGYCISLQSILSEASRVLEGDQPLGKVLLVLDAEPPSHPLAKGAAAAEKLAKTDEARLMLRAVNAAQLMNKPFAVAPGVPGERVQVLRAAFAQVFADASFIEDMQRARQAVVASSGEEIDRLVQGVLSTPPETLAKLREALK